MTYVLAKYALILILAAIAGFGFGRWMTRRNLLDVTENPEIHCAASSKSDDDLSANLASIEGRLEAVSEVVGSLSAKLDKLGEAVRCMPQPERAPNLAPIQTGLAALRRDFQRIPVMNAQTSANLDPIDERYQAIESALNELRKGPVEASPSQASPAS